MKKNIHKKSKKEKRRNGFAGDMPKDCKLCYFWNRSKSVCALGGMDNCYYRTAPPEEEEDSCRDCPYGKYQACIAYCTVEVMQYSRKGGRTNG